MVVELLITESAGEGTSAGVFGKVLVVIELLITESPGEGASAGVFG